MLPYLFPLGTARCGSVERVNSAVFLEVSNNRREFSERFEVGVVMKTSPDSW